MLRKTINPQALMAIPINTKSVTSGECLETNSFDNINYCRRRLHSIARITLLSRCIKGKEVRLTGEESGGFWEQICPRRNRFGESNLWKFENCLINWCSKHGMLTPRQVWRKHGVLTPKKATVTTIKTTWKSCSIGSHTSRHGNSYLYHHYRSRRQNHRFKVHLSMQSQVGWLLSNRMSEQITFYSQELTRITTMSSIHWQLGIWVQWVNK